MAEKKSGLLSAVLFLVGALAVAALAYGGLSRNYVQNNSARSASTEISQTQEGEQPSYPLLENYNARLTTEAGIELHLSDIAAGRPLVMNFWATWCPYCVEELPSFQELYGAYADRVSFAFIDVCDGSRETVEGAQSWLAENGFSDLPAYYDTQLEASSMYGASAIPMTVLVSANGEIVQMWRGMIDADVLQEALEAMV